MCYLSGMTEVGLRELRQNASDLVKRVEAGESFTVTVSGRPAATLSPVSPPRWRSWEEVGAALSAPADPDWERDRDRVDQSVRDPWAAS
jgi:prevent-host-death family protein